MTKILVIYKTKIFVTYMTKILVIYIIKIQVVLQKACDMHIISYDCIKGGICDGCYYNKYLQYPPTQDLYACNRPMCCNVFYNPQSHAA